MRRESSKVAGRKTAHNRAVGGLLSSERREREREGSRRRKVATIRIFTGVIRYEPHNARNDGVKGTRGRRGDERSSTNVHARGNGPWARLISPGIGES